MTNYKTVKCVASDTIYEKKSEFIGYISPAKTESAAQEFLNQIRKKHYDATHHCYAYIIKDEKIQRQSDDGEPSKTAGMPILEVLRHEGIEDVIIVVVRYYGGTLLGTGGLVRAYTEGAKVAVSAAEILSYSLCVDISISVEYPLYDKLVAICQAPRAKLLDTVFTDKVAISIRVPDGTQQSLIDDITIITKGLVPSLSDTFYDIF